MTHSILLVFLLFTFNCTANCKNANEEGLKEQKKFNAFVEGLVTAARDSQRRIFSTTCEAINKLKDKFEEQDFVSKEELADWFSLDSDSDEWHMEKSALENLGFIVPSDNDTFCFKPAWITETAYQAINHPLLAKKGGIISHSKMRHQVLENEPEAERIIQFLLEQKVAHSSKLAGGNTYFSLMRLLPKSLPLLKPCWSKLNRIRPTPILLIKSR